MAFIIGNTENQKFLNYYNGYWFYVYSDQHANQYETEQSAQSMLDKFNKGKDKGLRVISFVEREMTQDEVVKALKRSYVAK